MLYLLLLKKEKKRKGTKWPEGFFQSIHALVAVPCQDFLSFYMQLKGVLKVSP
jgi:hypothetical protein